MTDPYTKEHCPGENFSFRWKFAHLYWYQCFRCGKFFSRPIRDRMKAKTRSFAFAYSGTRTGRFSSSKPFAKELEHGTNKVDQ